MSKRVQVTFSDEEFEMLSTLANLRSESMSVVIGDLLTADVRRAWRTEIAARELAARKFARADDELNRRLEQLG